MYFAGEPLRALLHLAPRALDVDRHALAVADELTAPDPDVADEAPTARPHEVGDEVSLLDDRDEARIVGPEQHEIGPPARLDRSDPIEPERRRPAARREREQLRRGERLCIPRAHAREERGEPDLFPAVEVVVPRG